MESEKCRLYVPPKGDKAPPRKRQRIAEPLRDAADLRRQVYHDLWRPVKGRIEHILNHLDASVIDDVSTFVSDEASTYRERNVIPTGLIVTGPNLTYQNAFLARVFQRLGADGNSLLILLESTACVGLKGLLREVTRQARERGDDEDEAGERAGVVDDAGDDERQGESWADKKYFDYDLEWVRQRCLVDGFENVVVAVRDTEAFDGGLLAQAVDVFHSWLDRIPFVFFFTIGVSTENFQDSLPTSSIRVLKGREFNVSPADLVLEQLFRITVDCPENRMVLGPNITTKVMIRSKDHLQSIDAFPNAMQYAYMTHFYANRLSVLLSNELQFSDVPSDVFEGARNLPSYRRWAESEVEAGRTREVKGSLESDEKMFSTMRSRIESGLALTQKIVEAVKLFETMRSIIQPSATDSSFASLYIAAMSGELEGSPTLRETFLHLKKVPSDTLERLFEASLKTGSESSSIDFIGLQNQLRELVAEAESKGPLRSQHDVRNSSLRTTVVSQKIELSKHKSSLSKHDAAYSELLESFQEQAQKYFAETLIDPRELPFHEVFIYDVKSLQTDAFVSRPRYVIERALASPSDYLGCRCCTNTEQDEGEEGDRSIGNQPATAILYQLYLESGALINVADLRTAFLVMLGQPEEEDELARAQALFQRGLAELKYFGMVRPTKKKTDHIAKVMWKGL